MRARWLAWLAAPLLVLAYGNPVWAQYSSSSRQGTFGSRTMGGAVNPGNRTFGGSGLGSTGLGGSNGLGGGSFSSGRGSMGGSSGLGSMGIGTSGGMLGSNERFVRGSRQAGQFVGSDAQDLTNVLGGVTGAGNNRNNSQTSRSGLNIGTTGRNARGNQPNQPNQRNQRNQRNRGGTRGPGGRGSAEQVAVTVSTDFHYPQPVLATVSSSLATRLGKSTRIGRLSTIQVATEGGTTILRGAVETAHDRALAEQLALLEPGVQRVKNELVVGRPSESAPAPSAGPKAGTAAPLRAGPPATTRPLNPGEPPSP